MMQQGMAQKYRALARSYEDLAKHYQAVADAGSANNTKQSEKSSVATQKVSSATVTSEVSDSDEAELSPWSDSLQDQRKQEIQSERESVSSADTVATAQAQPTAALNSLNLPEKALPVMMRYRRKSQI